ncbi:MAG TPA: hypothetical protein VGZ26_04640, partial [Pirellulales bacterium]|nr:hypothetical protein [Pirellulales bacterium]
MSSEPDSASLAPADPETRPAAERSPESPAAAHPSEGAGPEAEARGKAPPIRIGTQRYGVKPPAAVAKPVLPSPPAHLLARARGIADDEQTPDSSAILAAEESVDAHDQTAANARTTPPSSAKPGKKQGGKQPRASRSMPEQAPPRKYPPPNTRGQLSPDLELEFMEALGGESLDEIIAQGTPDTVVVELEPESRHKGKVIQVHR